MKAHFRIAALACGAILLAGSAATAQGVGAAQDFQNARQLKESGKVAEAFRAYLSIPGAEDAAVSLARPKTKTFLALLASPPTNAEPHVVQVVEADLLLTLDRREEALASLRAACAGMPAEYYPVERPAPSHYRGWPLVPFSLGPGSHRDNRLIRRFIALDAWEDAARELSRVWEMHKRNAEPHVLSTTAREAGRAVDRRYSLVTPVGFNGQALQFAVDYAYFLKKRNKPDAALDVLLDGLSRMDMDRDPNLARRRFRKPISKEEADKYPRPERSDSLLLRSFWGTSAGISRKEFIRLAYGEFKAAGREDELVAKLQARMAAGENASRRVLARIRFHQGRQDEALALELDYIEKAGFPVFTATYRRGRVYEALRKHKLAIEEYEKLASLPGVASADLPDPDEDSTPHQPQPVMVSGPESHGVTSVASTARRDAAERLTRLYASQGKSDKVLDNELRRLALDKTLLERVDTLEEAMERFRAGGREKDFERWLETTMRDVDSPTALASIHWVLGNCEASARALAESARDKGVNVWGLDAWKKRFKKQGSDKYRLLLKAIVAANPGDARTRLELLDTEDRFEGREAIEMLELLLDSDADFAFARGKGVRNRTRFRNYFDLAYRLMRLYERTPGHEDKLLALGFRVLEGKKPFQREPGTLARLRANWNDGLMRGESRPLDILDCLYVLLAHLKRPADIERADSAIRKTRCIPLINQLNRLRKNGRRRITPVTGKELRYRTVEVRTLGAPPGVRLLTNRDDVRAIAPGARWGDGVGQPGRVWVGTSWGLVRYRERGHSGETLEILQVPLGAGVLTFAETPSGLYVGTRDGSFRLDDPDGDSPRPVRVGIEASDGRKRDRVERHIDRNGKTRVEHVHEAFPVHQVLWWQDRLWVCSRDSVYRYDPETQQCMHLGKGGAFRPLYTGAGRLWASRAVYDSRAEEFKAIDSDRQRWHLIGVTDTEAWADVWVNDKVRHRPAVVDLETFELTVLPINDPERGGELQNSEFTFLGEHEGRVWLAGSNPGITVVYERGAKALRVHRGPVPETAPWRRLSPAHALSTVGLDLRGDRGPKLCARPLTGGRLLVGNAIVREWREDNLGYDDNGGMSHHVQDLEGGLFVVDPAAGTWRKIGAAAEELSDFYVKRVVRDGDRVYICTNGGVTILSLPNGRILGRVTVSDGLPSNKVEDVARIGRKLYYACELGDEGGGLAVQDLDTGLIQALSMSDGLKSNKIKKLRVDGKKLHVLYGTIYGVRAYGTPQDDSVPAPVADAYKRKWRHAKPDDRVRTFRSSVLDTVTGEVKDGSEILPAAFPPEVLDSPLPFLGGTALWRDREALVADPDGHGLSRGPLHGHGRRGSRPSSLNNGLVSTNGGSGFTPTASLESPQKRPCPDNPHFIAGTHGLLMITNVVAEAAVEKVWRHEDVAVARSARAQQLAEATERPMDVTEQEDLEAALADPNPFYRARAAATMLGREERVARCMPTLIALLDDPELRVRSTALFLLSRTDLSDAALDAAAGRLADRDGYMRAFATILLCENGRIPDMACLRKITNRRDVFGNFPFGPTSSVGVVADRERLYAAVAPHADGAILELFLDHPLTSDDYEPRQKVFRALGEALNARPGAADVLLRAYTKDRDPGPESNYGAARFAQEVFKCAGPRMLPILHEALQSSNRVVRSNAARACGAIGNVSSVAPLMAALDLESGLSRASIVWALGELKAGEALPELAELYVDARNDEQRRGGSGFRAAQAEAAIQSHYNSFRNLDSIGSEWNELKATSRSEPVDPQANEWLLSTRIVLAAVRKIGPAAAQDFYRMLAGEKDAEGRRQAAECLAEGQAADRDRNLPILRNMLADEDRFVQIQAAVSLVILGDDAGENKIIENLEGDGWQKRQALEQLLRVKERSRRAFADEHIAAIGDDPAFRGSSGRRVRDLVARLLGR